MTAALETDEVCKPATAGETTARKLHEKQAEINKRILAAMASSDDNQDDAEDETLNHLNCGICLSLCDRPVTASCQHNFCLKCFKRWVNQQKTQCPTCRATFSKSLIQNPRINTMLSFRMRQKQHGTAPAPKPPPVESDRPDEAFTTDKAKRAGLSNAASGRMRVTCHGHHFGPIGPDYDPERKQGVLVGECWTSRLHCRQWGSHMPHVAGIAGQSDVGAQSIVLSGGYEDDRDEGEWLLYTGSGGRDLSGNKRTNKEQSFDQVFEGSNKALLRGCERGLPVRVLRSYKEKRSAYAPTDPEWGIRYDGVYRIVAAWRHVGLQGKLVCRYLLRRCDNEPAPWSTSNVGDGPWDEDLPEDAYAELKADDAIDVLRVSRNGTGCQDPFWAYRDGSWGWTRSPPEAAAKKPKNALTGLQQQKRSAERNLAGCGCELCKALLVEPVCTPCGHNFCKACLVAKFAANEPTVSAARTFRARKAPKRCPTCCADLAEFAKEGAPLPVNHAMAAQIAGFQEQLRQANEKIASEIQAREAADAAPGAATAPKGTRIVTDSFDGDENQAANVPCGRLHRGEGGQISTENGAGEPNSMPVSSQPAFKKHKTSVQKTSEKPTGRNKLDITVADADTSAQQSSECGQESESDGDEDMSTSTEGSCEDSGEDWGSRHARSRTTPQRAAAGIARQKLRSSSRSPEKPKSSTRSPGKLPAARRGRNGAKPLAAKALQGKRAKTRAKGGVLKKKQGTASKRASCNG